MANAAVPWAHVRFAVSTTCRNKTGRGIYLREGDAAALAAPVEATVTVTPHMPETAAAQEKINFGVHALPLLQLLSAQISMPS